MPGFCLSIFTCVRQVGDDDKHWTPPRARCFVHCGDAKNRTSSAELNECFSYSSYGKRSLVESEDVDSHAASEHGTILHYGLLVLI